MIGVGTVWAFLGSLGPRELVVVAFVALIMYGRAGAVRTIRRSGPFRAWPNWPGTPPQPATPPAAPSTPWGNRWFLFLAIIAATAVAAWIITRTIILGAPGVSH